LQALFRRIVARRNVPRGAADEYRRAYSNSPDESGREASPAQRERFQRLAAEVEFAEQLPAFSRILIDREGNLWVRQYEIWEDAPGRSGPVSVPTYHHPSLWDVFTSRGVWLGHLELPADFAPLEIGKDYVAGVWRDTEDVEYVQIYRLTKP
jgi:hypothetical protein